MCTYTQCLGLDLRLAANDRPTGEVVYCFAFLNPWHFLGLRILNYALILF